jgi:hypothetical protein
VGNWLARFSAVWKWFEEPDNTSFYFYRGQASALWFSPTFEWLFPLGLAGLAAIAIGARRARGAGDDPFAGAWRFHPRGHVALCLWLAAVAGSLSFVHTVARFRLYVLPFFFVYAAVALVLFVRSLRATRFGDALLVAAIAGGGAWLQHAITSETEADFARPVDYFVAAKLSAEDGRVDRALAFIDQSARSTGDIELGLVIAQELETRRDWTHARATFEHVRDANLAYAQEFERRGAAQAAAQARVVARKAQLGVDRVSAAADKKP